MTYVVDLDFADRSRPTVKLGKFFYMSYGLSKLGRSLIFGQNFDFFSIFLRYSALFDQVPLLICKIWIYMKYFHLVKKFVTNTEKIR